MVLCRLLVSIQEVIIAANIAKSVANVLDDLLALLSRPPVHNSGRNGSPSFLLSDLVHLGQVAIAAFMPSFRDVCRHRLGGLADERFPFSNVLAVFLSRVRMFLPE